MCGSQKIACSYAKNGDSFNEHATEMILNALLDLSRVEYSERTFELDLERFS